MKVIGIQIDGSEAIIVVLEKLADGTLVQTDDCARFDIKDHTQAAQIQQFWNQVNATFNSIKPTKIGIRARNSKVVPSIKNPKLRPPSPISFKLEGIIQLYPDCNIDFVWPATIASFKKKEKVAVSSKNKYQQDAFDVAHYLINQ